MEYSVAFYPIRCDRCNHWGDPFYWEGFNPEPVKGTCRNPLNKSISGREIKRNFSCSNYEPAIVPF